VDLEGSGFGKRGFHTRIVSGLVQASCEECSETSQKVIFAGVEPLSTELRLR